MATQKICCKPNYFTNNSQINTMINLVAINGNPSNVGGMNFTVFYPFQIIAMLGFGGSVPNGGVGNVSILNPTPSVTSSLDLLNLFANLAMANRNDNLQNASGSVHYTPLSDTEDYSFYFQRFLNDALIPRNLFRALEVPREIQTFWIVEDSKITSGIIPAGDDDELSYFRMHQMIQNLRLHSDTRLWLPPGNYQIDQVPPNADPYAASLVNVFNGVTGGGDAPFFMTAELKSIQ